MALGAAGDIAQAVDFILRTFTAERCDFGHQASAAKAGTQLLFGKAKNKLIADDKPPFGQRFKIFAEALDGASALNVFTG